MGSPRTTQTTYRSASKLRLTLIDALGLLKPQDRAILVLRYWED
jgi:hypothetical protein